MTLLERARPTDIARPRTFLTLVLDESDSMDAVRSETIAAVNEFLRSQHRHRIDELFVTLIKFSSAGQIKTLYRHRPIAEAELLSLSTYHPRGCTALYDGMATGMFDAEKQTGAGDRILLVTMTDGEENASQHVTHIDQLRELIRAREARGNWTFVFLGANIDTYAVGDRMGVRRGNMDSYTTAAGGVQAAIAKVDAAVKSYRTADDLTTDSFFHQPKKWQRPSWARNTDVVLTDDEA